LLVFIFIYIIRSRSYQYCKGLLYALLYTLHVPLRSTYYVSYNMPAASVHITPDRTTYHTHHIHTRKTLWSHMHILIETRKASAAMHAYGKGKLVSTKSKIVRGVGKIKVVSFCKGEGRKYVVTTYLYICNILFFTTCHIIHINGYFAHYITHYYNKHTAVGYNK
jgi:hypothetical protein